MNGQTPSHSASPPAGAMKCSALMNSFYVEQTQFGAQNAFAGVRAEWDNGWDQI